MGFLESFIMGLTQGLTEFLPVSSSGHLALVEHIFNFKPESLVFEVGVHLGTLLSIFTVYRKVIFHWLVDLSKYLKTFQENDGAYLFFLVFISALPAGLIGVLFSDWITRAFSSLLIVGVSFLFTGFILFWAEKKSPSQKDSSFDKFANLSEVRSITCRQAFLIGLAQAFAILPGISRSGSTISMALFLGVPRKISALFSFLMSIPVILGASLIQFAHVGALSAPELKNLLFSIAVSYVFGLVGLLMILYVVKKAKLSRFSWYLWALGLGSIAFHFAGG